MPAPTTVLSPHLDDAVLSCWHVLRGAGEVRVVNVFTGVPDRGTVGSWDCLTGSQDSAARVRERLEEDREALALAGADAVNVGLLDGQYRRNGSAPIDVPEQVAGHIGAGGVVYAPAGIGLHPDHLMVRAAALALHAAGRLVRLYADLPHAIQYGWPAWVTGETLRPHVDPGAFWDGAVAETGLRLRPRVQRLDEPEWERKLAALRCYRTQMEALAHEAPLEELRTEVVWEVEQ